MKKGNVQGGVSGMKKKILSVMLGVTMLAASLTGCSGGKDAETSGDTNTAKGSDAASGNTSADGAKEYVIGGMGPLTGAAASFGVSVKNGAEIAINEINEAGGVKVGDETYMLRLEFADDEASEDKAVTAYNSLMDKKIDGFLGGVTSGSSLAIIDQTKADGIFQVTASGSAKDITRNGNVLRVCFTDPLQGEKMAEYIKNDLNLSKAAIIYNNTDDYSMGIQEAFIAKFEELGGSVVANEAFKTGEVDFGSQLTKIKGTDAEIIFVPAYYQDAAYITQQAKDRGIELPFVGSDGWDGILAKVSSAEAIEGAVFLSPFLASDPEVADFVDAYKATYNAVPDQFAADGYDAVYVFKAGMEKAGSIKSEDMLAVMTEIEVDGLTGHMKFDADGEPQKDAKFVVIEKGEYKALEK
jgi:branched-chain amino acid transport system substrate-binding protein